MIHHLVFPNIVFFPLTFVSRPIHDAILIWLAAWVHSFPRADNIFCSHLPCAEELLVNIFWSHELECGTHQSGRKKAKTEVNDVCLLLFLFTTEEGI